MPTYSLCGLDCSDCPCFLAWKNNNNDLRTKTAQRWSQEMNLPNLKAEDINCTGCLSDQEPHFSHCLQCPVRLCGQKRKIKNCGLCSDYSACQTIKSLHKDIPEGKSICDKLSKKTS